MASHDFSDGDAESERSVTDGVSERGGRSLYRSDAGREHQRAAGRHHLGLRHCRHILELELDLAGGEGLQRNGVSGLGLMLHAAVAEGNADEIELDVGLIRHVLERQLKVKGAAPEHIFPTPEERRPHLLHPLDEKATRVVHRYDETQLLEYLQLRFNPAKRTVNDRDNSIQTRCR